MTLQRFSFMSLLLVFSLLLVGCGGDISEKLHGSWKSEKVDPASGKHIVVVLTGDTMNFNGKSMPIVYKAIALSVDIADAASDSSLVLATHIEKASMTLQGSLVTDKVDFVRITEDEAQELLGQE